MMPKPGAPVMPGFFPDPSICRVGDEYYLVCSSFEYAPGVPIFRSTDLRSWQQIGNVLDRPSQLDVTKAGASGGITAPTLRYHDGRFWMITTNLADGGWQLLVHSENPAGPWSDPVRFPAGRGIDPDLAWDADGTCYLTYAGFGANGPAGIVQSVVDPLTGEALTERRPLWQGTGGMFPEGPHLYQVGEFWYLLIAEGGTARGHAVTIARGSSPSGPFEPCPWNPLITARGTDEPVQNTGHADLVQRPDGAWAMVFHGVRARGSSPEWHVLGRETHAVDVVWEDGWPRLAGALEPIAGRVSVPELQGSELEPGWVAPRVFPAQFLEREVNGWRLTADENDADAAFVGRRQQHLYARVGVALDAGGGAAGGVGGLSVRIDSKHRLDLEVDGAVVRAVATIGPLSQVLGETSVSLDGEVALEIRALPNGGHFSSTETGPDLLVAGLLTGDDFTELGRLDGRYVSTEVAGGMTGRLFGIYCSRGHVLVSSFRYTGADEPSQLEDL